jgi:hypothetical protein
MKTSMHNEVARVETKPPSVGSLGDANSVEEHDTEKTLHWIQSKWVDGEQLVETEAIEEPAEEAVTEHTKEERDEKESSTAVISMAGWVSLWLVWKGLVEVMHWHFAYSAGLFAIAILLFGCVCLSSHLRNFIAYGLATVFVCGLAIFIVEAVATVLQWLHWLVIKL